MNLEGIQYSKVLMAGLPAIRLKLPGNWHGLVADRDSAGNDLPLEEWADMLRDPLELLENPLEDLKPDGLAVVISKKLSFGSASIKAVIKAQEYGMNSSDFFSSLMPPKSLRNFKTAAKLCKHNIPTARPLAALWHKNGVKVTHSVFISEYIPESENLYWYVREHLSVGGRKAFVEKKQLSIQAADIFSSLHRARLWHRDAKAGNFLVRKLPGGQPYLMLVDMDGIKPYVFAARTSRYRSLSKLAATIMWSDSVYMTDYLRTFMFYCNLTGVDESRRLELFRRLARRAIGMRLLTFANSAMKQARKDKSKQACQ